MATDDDDWAALPPEVRAERLRSLVERGDACYRAGDSAQAIADWSEALARHDALGLAWHSLTAGEREPLLRALFNRGVTHEQNGRPAHAIADFSEALARHDALGLAWHSLTAGAPG